MDEVIFASRIVGLPVLDADGLAIGHAATWSSGPDDRGPPVIGFVVAAPAAQTLSSRSPTSWGFPSVASSLAVVARSTFARGRRR